MFKWLTNDTRARRKARDLYGAVVAQARLPVFYSDLGVADTPEGRYEMIALHLILTLERLGQADIADEELRRETLETFITDLDDAMREFGIGDTSVPKRVKRAAGGVYDRGVAYREARVPPDNAALEQALIAHVYQGEKTVHAKALAVYVRQAALHLSALSPQPLRDGVVSFPIPELRS